MMNNPNPPNEEKENNSEKITPEAEQVLKAFMDAFAGDQKDIPKILNQEGKLDYSQFRNVRIFRFGGIFRLGKVFKLLMALNKPRQASQNQDILLPSPARPSSSGTFLFILGVVCTALLLLAFVLFFLFK